MLTRPAMQWEYEERGAWKIMSACYESALNEATMDGGTVTSLTMEVEDDPTKSSFYRFDLVNMTQTHSRDDEDMRPNLPPPHAATLFSSPTARAARGRLTTRRQVSLRTPAKGTASKAWDVSIGASYEDRGMRRDQHDFFGNTPQRRHGGDIQRRTSARCRRIHHNR